MPEEREIKRSRRIAVVLAVSTVMSILFLIYGILQKAEASKQAEIAELLKVELVKVRVEAKRSQQQAIAAQREAEKQHQLAEEAVINCNKRK